MHKSALLLLPLLLSGCTVAVKYGDVLHSRLAENPRCNPAQNDDAAIAVKDHFIVTSRLPDCRGDNILLTNHRADRVRFGLGVQPGDEETIVRFARWACDTVWERLDDKAQVRAMYRRLR